MSFHIWMIGKTKDPYLQEGIREYEKRVSRFLSFATEVHPQPRNAARLAAPELMLAEAEIILRKLEPTDHLILLDEKGKAMDSVDFAGLLEKRMMHSGQRTVFLIGGAYGFAEPLRHRADGLLSLSKMTFSHQLVRLIFWEQLYRAVSIIHGLPYHNS